MEYFVEALSNSEKLFFIYSLLSPIAVTDGPYGGYGGNPWSDGPLSTNEDITAIEIREGHILDAIRVR